MTKSSLPKGWRLVKFGDLVRKLNNQVDPESSGISRYVAGEHMDTDNLSITRWGVVGDGYLGPAFKMRFQPGQILYGSRRTYLRKVAMADFEGICANTTFVLESKSEELLQEFLPHVMSTEKFHEYSISKSKGSVNPYINFVDLNDYEFVLPPIAEQHRIVQLISSIDKTRHLKLSVDSDQLINALYYQKSNAPDRNIKLGEVCSFSTASVKELDSLSIINYIDLSCVSRDGGIEPSSVEKFVVSTAPSRAQRIVNTGDVLVATVRPNLRAVAWVSSKENGWVASTGFAVLRAQNETDSLFLFGLALTEAFTKYLALRAIGSNYPAVRNGDIKSFPIPLEIYKNRQEISQVVGQILNVQNLVKIEIENFHQLRRTALEHYLRAEVNV